jgi:hypothetical protein
MNNCGKISLSAPSHPPPHLCFSPFLSSSFLMGCIIFFVPLLGWYSEWDQPSSSWSLNGTNEGIMALGATTYMCLIWAMSIKVLFMQRTWTWFMPGLSVGLASIAFYYLAILLYNSEPVHESVWTANFVGAFTHVLGNTISWLIVILVSGIVIITEIFLISVQHFHCCKAPTPTDLLMAYDHGLGPRDESGNLMKLTLRTETEKTETDEMDDHSLRSSSSSYEKSDDQSVRQSSTTSSTLSDPLSESMKSDDSEISENKLLRSNSQHSGTSRTSVRRKWGKAVRMISAKNLFHLSSTMGTIKKQEMGLQSLKSGTSLYICY